MWKSKACEVGGGGWGTGWFGAGVGQAHRERGKRGQARRAGRVSDVSERSLDLTLQAGAMQGSNTITFPLENGRWRRRR